MPGEGSNARDLSGLFPIHMDFAPDRRWISLENEPCKCAMNGAARTNTFEDFLPTAAPLSEVQGPGLFSFLRKIALADVYSIAGNPECNAVKFKCFIAGWRRPTLNQRVPQWGYMLWCQPHLMRFPLLPFATDQRHRNAFPLQIAECKRLYIG